MEVEKPNEFQRAKSFWQTRAVPESEDASSAPPPPSGARDDHAMEATATPAAPTSSFAQRMAAFEKTNAASSRAAKDGMKASTLSIAASETTAAPAAAAPTLSIAQRMAAFEKTNAAAKATNDNTKVPRVETTMSVSPLISEATATAASPSSSFAKRMAAFEKPAATVSAPASGGSSATTDNAKAPLLKKKASFSSPAASTSVAAVPAPSSSIAKRMAAFEKKNAIPDVPTAAANDTTTSVEAAATGNEKVFRLEKKASVSKMSKTDASALAAGATTAANPPPPSIAERMAAFEKTDDAASAPPVADESTAAAAIPTTSSRKNTVEMDSRPSNVPVASENAAAASASPSTPAPEDTKPLPPSPCVPPPPPAPAATDASKSASTNVVNSMFKTKLFGASSRSSSVDDTNDNSESPRKEKENSSSMTLPSLPVQLPDMTSWKEKMKSYSSKSKTSGATSRMNLSFANISSSWKSMSTMSHSSSDGSSPTKGSSPSAGSVAKHNIHNPCHRAKPTSNPITSGSPYGELIVAEILAAKDLAVGDFIQGESDPYVVVGFDDKEKHSAACASTLNPVYNERFVFWVPSSPTIDEQLVSITVWNKNMVIADEHLGEVHLSLAIPVNEAFDEWYPLVKEDGSKKGNVRVGVRRMVLTSPSLLLAAQSLAAAEGSLDDGDLAAHGSTIPELWYGFAEAQEPMDVDEKPKQTTDLLTSRLNHLSRRLMGIELTSSSSEAKRNVF